LLKLLGACKDFLFYKKREKIEKEKRRVCARLWMPAEMDELRQEVARLRTEVAELRKEVARMQQKVRYEELLARVRYEELLRRARCERG